MTLEEKVNHMLERQEDMLRVLQLLTTVVQENVRLLGEQAQVLGQLCDALRRSR